MNTRRTLTALALAAASLAGAVSLNSCGKTLPRAAEAKTEAAIAVRTSKVSMAPMAASLKVTGTLEGIREATVQSETQGRVLSIVRSIGDRVAAGTPIVKVDDELKIVAVHQAEAARLSAEAALDKAKLDLERTKQLVHDNASTRNQLELAQLQVKSCEASLKGAQASEAMARRQLADATVKAPISGVVSDRFVNQGEMLSTGAKVETIVDDSKMKLRLNVGELDIPHVKVGDKVKVSVDALGKDFTGTVTAISGKADLAHAYDVEVELPNPGSLKSGMFARAEIERQAPHDVPTVPNEAIITNGTKTQVYLVTDGVANLRAVKTGTATPERVEILDGLNNGDEVVTFGQNMLHDGAKIKQ